MGVVVMTPCRASTCHIIPPVSRNSNAHKCSIYKGRKQSNYIDSSVRCCSRAWEKRSRYKPPNTIRPSRSSHGSRENNVLREEKFSLSNPEEGCCWDGGGAPQRNGTLVNDSRSIIQYLKPKSLIGPVIVSLWQQHGVLVMHWKKKSGHEKQL